MPDAGDERVDWLSFYERLYTMNISTGRSPEPIGLEKYLDAVTAELREQLKSDREDNGSGEAQEQHRDPEAEAGSSGVAPSAHEQREPSTES